MEEPFLREKKPKSMVTEREKTTHTLHIEKVLDPSWITSLYRLLLCNSWHLSHTISYDVFEYILPPKFKNLEGRGCATVTHISCSWLAGPSMIVYTWRRHHKYLLGERDKQFQESVV